jgi:hypothetical protein
VIHAGHSVRCAPTLRFQWTSPPCGTLAQNATHGIPAPSNLSADSHSQRRFPFGFADTFSSTTTQPGCHPMHTLRAWLGAAVRWDALQRSCNGRSAEDCSASADGGRRQLRTARDYSRFGTAVRRVRKDVQPCEFRRALCCEATMTYAVRTTGHAAPSVSYRYAWYYLGTSRSMGFPIASASAELARPRRGPHSAARPVRACRLVRSQAKHG